MIFLHYNSTIRRTLRNDLHYRYHKLLKKIPKADNLLEEKRNICS